MNGETVGHVGVGDDRPDVLVIGGGLAGLTAAAYAARSGASVTLLEARSTPGGRARTVDEDGFLFNEGPHALYLGGAAWPILRDLGVAVRGGWPPLGGSRLAVDGRIVRPGPRTVGPNAVKWGARALRSRTAGHVDGMSLADWLSSIGNEDTAAMLGAVFRLTSYLADPEHIDAAAALTQLRRSMRGVKYLDGGWATLVAGLASAGAAAGVRTLVDQRVRSIAVTNDDVEVELESGSLRAGAVVVAAGGPATAANLLGGTIPTLSRWAATARPATAACLDVGLSALPNRRHTTILGIDRPTYFVVHSKSAQLAPTGGHLIHVMRYGADLDPDADHRSELEGLLDVAQPGWRDHLVHARFGRRLMVCHDRPQPGVAAAGRPEVSVPETDRVQLAGDWITGDGMLADAAIGSGRRAGERAASIALAVGRVDPVATTS